MSRTKERNDLMFGKKPPQAVEVETAILGAMLLDIQAIENCRSILSPDNFYQDSHQRICKAIYELYDAGSRIDFLTVGEKLKANSEFELIGGSYYLTTLTRDVVSSYNAVQHARIIKEKSILRDLIRMGSELIQKGFDDAQDCFDLMDLAENALNEIRKSVEVEQVKLIGEVAVDAYEDIREKSEQKVDIPGIPTGFKELDFKMGGLSAPDLTIIGAGTGEGKTSFALNIAGHISQNEAVAYYSLEMKAEQLAWKFFAEILEKPIMQIRIGDLNESEMNVLENAVGLIQQKKLYIKDTGGLSILEFKNSVRIMVHKKCVKVVIVDYLQLMTTNGLSKRFGTREQEISYISHELKSLGMELNIPIIALSQLNRDRSGTQRLYQLSDLRESGAIEQDADNVLFIFNPVKHKMDQVKMGGSIKFFQPYEILLQVEKCRLGDTGVIPMKFIGVAQRFEDFNGPEITSMPRLTALSEIEKRVKEAIETNQEDDDDELPF